MTLPNLLGHESLREAVSQSKIWNLHSGMLECHPDARTYLCSLFAPVCVNNPNKPSEFLELKPCNPLCTEVRDTCRRKLAGSPHNPPKKVWQEMFNCDNYPTQRGMCVGKKKRKATSGNSSSRKENERQVGQSNRRPQQFPKVVASQSSSAVATRAQQNYKNLPQCPVCEYNPSTSEIRSLVCAPMTQFIVKLKEAKIQIVKKTIRTRSVDSKGQPINRRSVNLYWRIQGKPKVLKGDKLPRKRKTYFYLQKPRGCRCGMLDKGNKNFILLGKYNRNTAIVNVIQPFNKNRKVRRAIRKSLGGSKTQSNSCGPLEIAPQVSEKLFGKLRANARGSKYKDSGRRRD